MERRLIEQGIRRRERVTKCAEENHGPIGKMVSMLVLMFSYFAMLLVLLPFLQLQLIIKGAYSLPYSVFSTKHGLDKKKFITWFLVFVLPVIGFVLTRPLILWDTL